MSMNCLSCKNYDKCESQYKSATTSCTQWTDGTTAVIDLNESSKNSRIIKIEMGTVEYVLEKVIESIVATLINDYTTEVDGRGFYKKKNTEQMFETFMDNLQTILNEIKENNKR